MISGLAALRRVDEVGRGVVVRHHRQPVAGGIQPHLDTMRRGPCEDFGGRYISKLLRLLCNPSVYRPLDLGLGFGDSSFPTESCAQRQQMADSVNKRPLGVIERGGIVRRTVVTRLMIVPWAHDDGPAIACRTIILYVVI